MFQGLFWKRELAQVCSKLWEKLGEFTLTQNDRLKRNSLNSLSQISLRAKETHWAWCLKPCSPISNSARFRDLQNFRSAKSLTSPGIQVSPNCQSAGWGFSKGVLRFFLGSVCGTVGKCTGPKWSKMVKNDHFGQTDLIPNRILIFAGPKMDQNEPFLVHFGLKGSILVHLGPPTVLWPFLIFSEATRTTRWRFKNNPLLIV